MRHKVVPTRPHRTSRAPCALSGLLACLLATSLVGCAGPYDDLEKDFGVEAGLSGEKLNVKQIVLVSTRHRGAYTLHPDVALTDTTVEIRARFPLSLAWRDLSLPAEAISGCSMTCFGMDDKNTDLLFEEQGAQISFDAASDLVEWCWQNSLPMLSGEKVRGWLYSGHSLPDKAAYVHVDRDEYEQQARSACMGY